MRKYRLFQYTLLAFIFTMFAGSVALAGSPTPDLKWGTVDGGGAIVSAGSGAGGTYSLGGTIGQPDAGVMSGSDAGGDFTLGGGFWGGGALSLSPSSGQVYLPIVEKNSP